MQRRRESTQAGAILVPLLVALFAVAGFTTALAMVTRTFHRSAFASLDREFAHHAAE